MDGFADSLTDLSVDITDHVLMLNVLCGLNKNFEHLHAIFTHVTPFPLFLKVLDDFCSREFRGCRHLPPLPSTSRKSLCRPLPQLVGGNACQDSSSTNNTLINNSCSSLARRRITTTTAMVATAVGVAPPPPLLPRACGPPTSTPGLALFKCGRVWGGGQRAASPPVSAGHAGRRPSLWSSTTGWATLHATSHASAHSPWLGGSGSGGMVPMVGLVGSTVVGPLLQHHDHGPSCGHRLGG
jgi:hypothetical protein